MKIRHHKITAIVLTAFKKALFKNLSLKLIAAFITLTLFILVAGESLQISKRGKIEYVTPENMMIVNEVPFEFEIILSGPKSIMGFIRGQDFYYKVDLTGASAGPSRVRINPRQLGLDRGILVSGIMPSTLYPQLEKVLVKKIPIKLNRAGTSAIESQMKRVSLEPAEVEVSGPESKVSALSHILTTVFDMRQVTKTQTFEIGLIHGDPQLSFLNIKDDKVKIRVEVLRK
ncbi:MAG: hypothetical protein HYY61_06755 [Deltaproteobacteria bacterium]|nr:hypothetical protein [Deltaproteobacteria bacterium]